MMATAARLAARRRRGIHVLVTIAVPADEPDRRPVARAGAAAQSIIEQAKVQAGRRVTGHWEKVRAGQTGRRIVDEARAMQGGGDRDADLDGRAASAARSRLCCGNGPAG